MVLSIYTVRTTVIYLKVMSFLIAKSDEVEKEKGEKEGATQNMVI